MSSGQKVYLALGDSMSIDDYTGVSGGGAVSQFYRTLGSQFLLNDCSFDGCAIPQVPVHHHGDIITITIGGNDALQRIDELLSAGVSGLAGDHLRLLKEIRERNPESRIIVGNIYQPQERLPDNLLLTLNELNSRIESNVRAIEGRLADIHGAFKGNEREFLCENIEPTLAGATAIAELLGNEN
jgi:lysophospholipase L1-like esterase